MAFWRITAALQIIECADHAHRIQVADGYGAPPQVSKMIVQKAEPLENDLGSLSIVASAKARRDPPAGDPLSTSM